MFKPVGSLLNGVLGGSRAQEAAFAVGVRQRAQEVIRKRLKGYPEEILNQIQVRTVKNRILTIVAPAIVLGELHMVSKDLILEINTSLKSYTVKKLRLKAL